MLNVSSSEGPENLRTLTAAARDSRAVHSAGEGGGGQLLTENGFAASAAAKGGSADSGWLDEPASGYLQNAGRTNDTLGGWL